jgi:hypothetical protein
MMKFFRKYTKQLLAVFMALLLVVWLGGEALTSWLRHDYDTSKELRGTLLGQPIRAGDMTPILAELEILNSPEVRYQQANGRLYPRIEWQNVWFYTLSDLGVEGGGTLQQYYYGMASSMRRPLNDEDWFLLVTEARRNGVYVPSEAVEQFKVHYELTGPALQNLRRQLSNDDINKAIQSFLMVKQQAVLACRSTGVSEADVRQFVRETREKADVSVVVIDSKPFVDETYEPAEQEIEGFFDKYKSATSQPYGLEFGYEQPEAVQVEYIRVNSDALENQQMVSDDAAHQYWENHKNEFLLPASQPATRPTSQPASPPKQEPYPTFTEAKDEVIKKLKKAKADSASVAIARELITQLGKPWESTATTEPAGVREIPPGEKAPDVYQRLVKRMDLKYPGALSFAELPMMDAQALAKSPGIGQSTARAQSDQSIEFSEAAFYVAGLEARPDTKSGRAHFFRNLYETCASPFVGPNGDAYVFRTVKTLPKRPPDNPKAVRDQIVRDIRTQRAYDAAEKQANALKDRAAAGSLDAAFHADAELVKRLTDKAYAHPAPFSRMRFGSPYQGMPPSLSPNYVQGIGSDKELIEACFGLAGQTTTQPSRVLSWGQPQQRRWLVVQLHRILPPTRAEYDALEPSAVEYYRNQQQIELLANWFDPAEIRARLDWKPVEQQRRKGGGPGQRLPEAPTDDEG